MSQNSSRGRGKPSPGPSSTKNLKFTVPHQDAEQIKAEGERAAQLLNAPVYNLAINSVVQDIQNEIVYTQPHEHQKREWLYLQASAVGRVNQKLVEFVQLAQGLNLRELESEELAQQERAAEQGFGASS